MTFENYKPVDTEISGKYLDRFFAKYNVNMELEDTTYLKRVIQYTCHTLTMPEDSVLDKINLFIIGKGGFGVNSYDSLAYSVKEIKNAETAVEYFVKLILDNEAKKISGYDLFELRERVTKLEKLVKRLTDNN